MWQSIVALKSKHRVAMTGTPVRNSDLDIYAQLRFVNMDAIIESNKWTDASFGKHIDMQCQYFT